MSSLHRISKALIEALKRLGTILGCLFIILLLAALVVSGIEAIRGLDVDALGAFFWEAVGKMAMVWGVLVALAFFSLAPLDKEASIAYLFIGIVGGFVWALAA